MGRLVSSQLIELAQSPAVGPQANPGYTPSIGIISIKNVKKKKMIEIEGINPRKREGIKF